MGVGEDIYLLQFWVLGEKHYEKWKAKHYEKCISPLNLFGKVILPGPNEASLPYPKIYHLGLWFNGKGVLRNSFSALAIGKREMVCIFMICHCDYKKTDYISQ